MSLKNRIKRLFYLDMAYVSNNGTQVIRFYRFGKIKLLGWTPHQLKGRIFDYVVFDEVGCKK